MAIAQFLAGLSLGSIAISIEAIIIVQVFMCIVIRQSGRLIPAWLVHALCGSLSAFVTIAVAKLMLDIFPLS